MPFTNFPHGITSFGVPVGLGTQGLTGETFFVAPADSSTNKFREWARKHISTGKLFTTIAAAYAACTTGRNDTVYVFPGTYTVTTSLVWAKDNTHLVGLGGPLSRGGLGKSIYVNSVTATQANIIEVQGDNVQFHNMYLRNAGADAANLTALKLTYGENFYAANCQFVGHAGATQVDTDATSSLWFYNDSSGKPWGANFYNCRIGSASEIVRTAGSVIYFSGSTAVTNKYCTFVDCTVEGWCETGSVGTVEFQESYSIDRYLLFKDTLFYNFYVNNASTATQVFENHCGTTHNVLLMGSTCQMGHAAWNSTGIQYVYTSTAAPANTGGLMTAAT